MVSLLAHASMPFEFWEYVFLTVVHLINRLPTLGTQGNIHLTLLYNQRPDFGSLKIFGCLCFPCLRPYNAHKLQFRSSPCTFIGYNNTHKGYVCLSQEGRVYISRNVKFHEHVFPYHNMHISSVVPNSSS